MGRHKFMHTHTCIFVFKKWEKHLFPPKKNERFSVLFFRLKPNDIENKKTNNNNNTPMHTIPDKTLTVPCFCVCMRVRKKKK